jgi:predicted ATP-grasp superfamily ATP-dependent carboligase
MDELENDLFEIYRKPDAEEIHMVVGWRQWADAGAMSSGFPKYLIKRTEAEKIGELNNDDFYLFQIPGTHHLVRPSIKLEDGYRQSLERRHNELYYSGDEEKGVVIFLGDEPHLNVDRYADAFFGAARALGVRRIIGVAGVYGAVPYDRDRQLSCIYSLPAMRDELAQYAVNFSDYEGGASIGSYLVDRAEEEGIEFLVFYAFVPAYDFSRSSTLPQGIRIENDFKAWHDVLHRINHMLGLSIDQSDLQELSLELRTEMDAKIEEMEAEMPELNVREFLAGLDTDFNELSFVPLDDVWERELGDLFGDEGEE